MTAKRTFHCQSLRHNTMITRAGRDETMTRITEDTYKPVLLDLYCGAGGVTRGYQDAGFYVIGVDIQSQAHYVGDAFEQADALDVLRRLLAGGQVCGYGLDRIAVIHASPVCKKYTTLAALYPDNEYPDEIAGIRELLGGTGKIYVIENVETAPLRDYVMLCGTMFPGLRVYRHRLFECNPPIYFSPKTCHHWGRISGNAARTPRGRITPGFAPENGGFDFLTITGNDYIADDGRLAMGIDWMSKRELSQSIPPAYTEWIGQRLMETIQCL